MTIEHHPSDETLMAYAAGTLDEAHGLIVATHLAHCQMCRKTTRELTQIGGVAMERLDSVPVSDGLRAACMSRLDTMARATRPTPASNVTVKEPFDPLSLYERSKWRWIGPGIRRQDVVLDAVTESRAFLLKAAPGSRLPDHEHVGTEWTCVLQGAFRHHLGRFGVGDFDEAADDVEHDPLVEDGVECICLVAMSGELRLKSRIARLFTSVVRI